MQAANEAYGYCAVVLGQYTGYSPWAHGCRAYAHIVIVWFLREPGDLLAMALGDITDVFRTAACARALPVFYLACLL